MNPAGAAPAAEKLSVSQREALISLLADDDPAVYRTVREKILSYGPSAREWLRPHTLSNNPVLCRRAQQLVHQFGRQNADNRFLVFCLKQGEELDLEQGSWLLAQTKYPEINAEAYQALLDGYAGELRERINFNAGEKTILTTINRYLFGELGFFGNEQNFYEPENSYLNCVIDRRTGNPISLCVVCLLLARRLRLPIAGIGLPGHFVCRFQSSASELYIDAFNQGKLMTKADCVQYLLRGHYGLQDDYLTPVSPRRILMRVCGNLHRIYYHLKLPEETTRLQRYLIALAR
jgi:regulator of sirC expression with transglutaminase-like and TPR domain